MSLNFFSSLPRPIIFFIARGTSELNYTIFLPKQTKNFNFWRSYTIKFAKSIDLSTFLADLLH